MIVDASKGPALGQALAGAPGLDLRMLNVVRDPRAVAWSWNRRVERPHVTSGSRADVADPGAPRGRSVERPAARDASHRGAWEASGRRRLRYEDFVADPVGTLVAATARPRRPALRRRAPRRDATAGSCSGPATACPATRRGSAPAPSSSAVTTGGPRRCPPRIERSSRRSRCLCSGRTAIRGRHRAPPRDRADRST